jgi:NAD(P)-dependent dehydrogenase (short-subunit alcohol dehydrogenase family)
MSRVFITGSTTGLGLIAGTQLLALGHEVIFHARNGQRATELERKLPRNSLVVIGDLSSIDETLQVSAQVKDLGPLDAVINNAGAGYGGSPKRTTEDLPEIFAVNVLAPYVLTALIPASRLVYLSSSMHRVPPRLDDPFWRTRDWNGSRAYSESKLYVTALALAVARLRPSVFSNAVDPGWVPTRMGGQGAPDDLEEGAATQAGLATGDSHQLSGLTERYLHHMSVQEPDARTETAELQDHVLALGKSLSGLDL